MARREWTLTEGLESFGGLGLDQMATGLDWDLGVPLEPENSPGEFLGSL